MAKQPAGLCGLELMLDSAALATAAEQPVDAPAVIVLAGDCPFVSRHLLNQLRDIFCPAEEDRSWAWREFSGDDQLDPRDVLDEAATAPMFATATRVAVVRRADSFVSAARELLERIADRPRGNRGLVILEVKSFPATTRLAKAVARQGLLIDLSVPPRFNLSSWLRKWAKHRHQADLPAAAAGRLLERLGNDLGQVDQALGSLAAACPAKDRRVIAPEAVDALGGSGNQRTAWEMLNAAAAGQTAEAVTLLGSLLETGESPIGLSAQAASVFRRYATAARLLAGPDRPVSIEAALREAGVAAWPKALAEAEQALRHLGSRRCRELPDSLAELDRSLKAEASRGLRARLALERFFCMMADPPPAASGRAGRTRPSGGTR
jgi:DNA polymerase-3 subunit delta